MAAAGDAVATITAATGTVYVSLTPANTNEWVIHNITVDVAAELHFYNGTIDILTSIIPGGGWYRQAFHCTTSIFYRVRNVTTATGTINVGYDGMVTK